jgi:NodT family efflux transporter outer membrane factor (OMF) lipoprotein
MKMNHVRVAGLLLGAGMMTGCATAGKDFVAPEGPGTASFRHTGQRGAGVADRAGAPWWTVFADEALDRLERRALQDNPGIQASAARLLQARAQLGLTRALQAPTLAAGVSVSNTRTSSTTSQGLALGGRSIAGNEYVLGASLSYEVDLWGRLKGIVEAADAQRQAAEADYSGVRLLLSAQLASTYWQLRGAQAELAILQGAIASRRETQELVDARFNAGLSNELDVWRARVESANAQADLIELQRQRNALEHALATLTGASPSVPLALDPAAAMPAAPTLPPGVPADLLARRPDLIASVALLRAANAQVGVAEAAFYPSLQLTNRFGFASRSLRSLTDGDSRQFEFGPLALSLPIFDGGRNRANLALSQARYDEARANHQEKLLNALREVEDALSDSEQRQLQADAQAQAQQAAHHAYEVARARYERGVSSYLDVIDAHRSVLVADRAFARTQTQRLVSSVTVARALGGGWLRAGP